jgi:hypothetical protein
MRSGICHLCECEGELCESHALPHSQFNYVHRKSDGKAIAITDDANTPIHYSSDSWKTDLLCAPCESKLNRNYDSYGISVFRGQIAPAKRGNWGVTFTGVDRQRLRMFFLSLLWRISISTHESYSNIDLPYHWGDQLRDALLHERNIPNSRFTVCVYRLHDSTAMDGFTPDSLRSFIMAPFARQYENFISICYPFLGFFIETFVPRLPKKYAHRHGVLSGKSPVFMAPYQEILAVPEIMALLVRGLQKHDAGLSHVSKNVGRAKLHTSAHLARPSPR